MCSSAWYEEPITRERIAEPEVSYSISFRKPSLLPMLYSAKETGTRTSVARPRVYGPGMSEVVWCDVTMMDGVNDYNQGLFTTRPPRLKLYSGSCQPTIRRLGWDWTPRPRNPYVVKRQKQHNSMGKVFMGNPKQRQPEQNPLLFSSQASFLLIVPWHVRLLAIAQTLIPRDLNNNIHVAARAAP